MNSLGRAEKQGCMCPPEPPRRTPLDILYVIQLFFRFLQKIVIHIDKKLVLLIGIMSKIINFKEIEKSFEIQLYKQKRSAISKT